MSKVLAVRQLQRAAGLILCLCISACSTIDNLTFKLAGDTLRKFSERHAIPYLLESDDPGMGCALAESTTLLLQSFGRVTKDPDKIAAISYFSAGACAENAAREEELRYLRAIRRGDAVDAEDARIAMKRHYVVAAKRQLKGYNYMVKAYGELGGEKCPKKLKKDFDEFIYLAGMLSGLSALNSELSSTASIGVPKNIASKVERGAGCIDDNRWWGAPMALRAVVWSLLPGTKPEGEDVDARFEDSLRKADDAGIRLAYVMKALAAYGSGDQSLVKDTIRRYAKSRELDVYVTEGKLVDEIAHLTITGLSDRLWAEATGSRTPFGELGNFWDDPVEQGETIDLDDIL